VVVDAALSAVAVGREEDGLVVAAVLLDESADDAEDVDEEEGGEGGERADGG
jgi:hypothetical protein